MARPPADALVLAREKRDRARRARRLAGTQLDQGDRARLYQFAEELEQEAADLERKAALGVPSAPVTQPQQQVQQQQGAEPPTDPQKPKG